MIPDADRITHMLEAISKMRVSLSGARATVAIHPQVFPDATRFAKHLTPIPPFARLFT
jgi:hypothetical protein